MANRAADGLDDTKGQDDRGRAKERCPISVLDAVVNSGSDSGPEKGLREHPSDATENPGQEQPNLISTQPEEVAKRRGGIRGAGVGVREFFEGE